MLKLGFKFELNFGFILGLNLELMEFMLIFIMGFFLKLMDLVISVFGVVFLISVLDIILLGVLLIIMFCFLIILVNLILVLVMELMEVRFL